MEMVIKFLREPRRGINNMAYNYVNTYIDIFGELCEMERKFCNNLYEAIKNGLIGEIYLNISLVGPSYGKTYYNSIDYINKIKNSNIISLMNIFKEHHVIREKFLEKAGPQYAKVGFILSIENILKISKL